METSQIVALQKRLKVTADGDAGPATYTALFAKLGAKPAVAAELGRSAATNFSKYGISATPLRLAHFMAQVGHESGGFRYMEEIASGSAYEGRRDLGNTKPGDGKRYKGRGPLQLTGRANYRTFGQALGLNLEDDPAQVARPDIGLLVACYYWSLHKLNALADADDITSITRRVNGGVNGLADRRARLLRMNEVSG